MTFASCLRLVGIAAAVVAGACQTYDVLYTNDAGQCTECDGGCFDLSTNNDNCGACGFACGPSAFCGGDAGGVCQPCPTTTPNACMGYCADFANDNSNCGGCNVQCNQNGMSGQTCQGGHCQCAQATCDGACVDLQTDPSHCGSCTTQCPSATNETPLCTAGSCSVQCIVPYADCIDMPDGGCTTNLQTDPMNCGACGRSCNGGACDAGTCPITTYETSSSLTAFAIDPSYVYWADEGGISKELIVGGIPQIVNATALAEGAQALAVDGARIVWLDPTAVESQLLTGGSPLQLASFPVDGGTQGSSGVTLQGGYVYYGTDDGSLWRVPENASAMPNTVATAASEPIVVVADSMNAYFATSSGNVYDVAVTAQNGTPALFISTNQGITNLAIDSINVYWSSPGTMPGTGSVGLQAKGGTVLKPLVSGLDMPAAVASDGISLYWADATSISRVALDGTGQLTLANNIVGASAIAVDDTNVYWLTPNLVAATAK